MRSENIAMGAAAAAFVYFTYSLITDTGAAGWLNYLQQSLFGSYSMTLTAWLLIMGVTVIYGITAFLTMALWNEDEDQA